MLMKRKYKKAEKTVILTNKDGKKICLPASTTIADMVRMGITGIGIVKPDAPFDSDREYRT